MKRWIFRVHKKTAWIASFLFAFFALFTSKKALDYSSPPDREKDCDFAFPTDSTSSKPTILIVSPPPKPLPFEVNGGVFKYPICLYNTPFWVLVNIRAVADAFRCLAF